MNNMLKERIDKINQGIVPEGYKNTKVGIIPKKWKINKLGKCLDVRDGTHDSPQYTKIGIPFITSKNLVNGNIDWDNITYISNEDHEKFSQRSFVEDGDILFGMIGTIGNPLIVKKDFEFSIKNVALLKFSGKSINNKYVLGILESDIIYKQFFRKSNAGVQKFIGLGMIRSLEIPIPPLQEQEKIADILTTWDKSIEKIEKLIKEKDIQKKGLMQQLLTGETRLPGFNEEWKEVKLGELSKIITGTTPSTKKVEYFGEKYPWVTPTDISHGKYIKETERNLSEKGIKVGRFVPKDSLLITCIASIGKNAILEVDGSCNQQINAIYPSDNHSNEFLYYLLSYKENYLLSYASKTATMMINKNTFENIAFIIPLLEEQEAISEILSTADKEIELLKQLLENKKEEKKGLMQLLLTGIVRV